MEPKRRSFADFSRVFDILRYQREKYPNDAALNSFNQDQWQGLAIEQIQHRVDSLSAWLYTENINRGDTVVLVPVLGSPEWMIIDFACQQLGVVTVPMHPTLRPEEIQVIFNETQPKICIAADAAGCKPYKSFERTRLFHLQCEQEGYFFPLQQDFSEREELSAIQSSITEDDVVTILYTSGSSGIPKGVVLTHRNIVHNIKAVLTLLPLMPGHRVMSFLPFSHILERMACYSYIAFGVSVYFSQRKESFAQDFKTVRPYACTSVPRVLEKMHDFLEEQMMGRNWAKRKLIGWAMLVGKKYGTPNSNLLFAMKLLVARILVLRLWRNKLGGRIRYMVVGGAALRADIGRLFSAAGIHVVEGYGMTETAPLISINRFEPGQNRFGTVGIPIPGIEIMIDNPNIDQAGEILVKGPNVMKEYFKKPELTNQVFTPDGWFRTGDVGKIVHGRFLKITDRKKDIFKTSAGKYIAPQVLQSHFVKSPYILRCLIIGFQRPFVTALIVPHVEILEAWCRQHHVHWTSLQYMVHNIKVRALIQQEVDRLNQQLENIERVKDFVLCHEDWTVERGELTNTLKPIRRNLLEHYSKDIEKMYS